MQTKELAEQTLNEKAQGAQGNRREAKVANMYKVWLLNLP